MTILRRVLILYSTLAIAAAISTVFFCKHKESVEVAAYDYSSVEWHSPIDDDKDSYNYTPPIIIPNSYEYKPALKKVMEQLAKEGPNDYYYDGNTDCKDWSITFMELWYEQDVPDGSCKLVRNVNVEKKLDHLMVAVYDNSDWLVIEPQACKWEERYWDPQMWWGDRYDPSYNMFFQSWLYLHHADRSIGDLMSKTYATNEEFEWSMHNEIK